MTEHAPAPAPADPVLRPFWLVVAVVTIGGGITWLVSDFRAGLSFAGAVLVASLAFALGAAGIRAAGKLAPFAAMIAAVGGYGITVLLFALIYAIADPDVLNFSAVAAGLLCAVGVWVFTSIRSLTSGVNDER